MKSIIFYLPRSIVIIYVLFLGIFSLDVFGAGRPLFETLIGFVIHNLPGIALIIILVTCWKRSKCAANLFILAAIIFTIFFKTYLDIIVFLIISMPLVIIGLLYIIDQKINIEKQEKKC